MKNLFKKIGSVVKRWTTGLTVHLLIDMLKQYTFNNDNLTAVEQQYIIQLLNKLKLMLPDEPM